jgi:hypothetical protein
LACGGLKQLKIESMQPLIDQGRQVWLWPDKDGVEGWQEVADKLGSPNVHVYTKFFDACWIEEDGPKADIADIAVRMLYHPDWMPREIKTDEPKAVEPEAEPLPPKPDGISDEEWRKHLDIMRQIGNYELAHPNDEPFLDVEELRDPRLHQWRETLKQKHLTKKNNENKR